MYLLLKCKTTSFKEEVAIVILNVETIDIAPNNSYLIKYYIIARK